MFVRVSLFTALSMYQFPFKKSNKCVDEICFSSWNRTHDHKSTTIKGGTQTWVWMLYIVYSVSRNVIYKLQVSLPYIFSKICIPDYCCIMIHFKYLLRRRLTIFYIWGWLGFIFPQTNDIKLLIGIRFSLKLMIFRQKRAVDSDGVEFDWTSRWPVYSCHCHLYPSWQGRKTHIKYCPSRALPKWLGRFQLLYVKIKQSKIQFEY